MDLRRSAPTPAAPPDRWNHNIHYHRVVLRRIPPDAVRALDVGCGEGMLTRELRHRIPQVIGIDRDAASITRARAHGGEIDYVDDDVLTHDFGSLTFDLVASIATLHHLDARTGLQRLAGLVAPNGRLVVIGLARRVLPRDLGWELAGAVTTRLITLRRTYWEHSAPMTDPTDTHAELQRVVDEVLPGARYTRMVLWRYRIVWTRPAGDGRTP